MELQTCRLGLLSVHGDDFNRFRNALEADIARLRRLVALATRGKSLTAGQDLAGFALCADAVVEVAFASPHPWGDVDCGGEVTPVDSLKLLRFDAGLGVTQPAGCPEMGSAVLVVE